MALDLQAVERFLSDAVNATSQALVSPRRSVAAPGRAPARPVVQPRARGPQNARARDLTAPMYRRTSPRKVETMQGRRVGGVATTPTPAGYSTDGMLADIRQRALAEVAGLDAAYARDRGELMGRFQLSETAEERALLAGALQNMQQQRDASLQAIGSGYADARDRVTGRAAEARGASQTEGRAAQQVYMDAAASLAGANAAVGAGLQGTGLGAASAAPSTADFEGLLTANGASTGTLETQLGEIRAGDMEYLAESLAGESLAQQGDLQRLALAAMADTQFKHGTRVQDRIANERMAAASMLAGLQGDYRGRRWDVSDQDRDYAWRFAELGSRDRLARDELALRREQFDYDRRKQDEPVDPIMDLLGPPGLIRDLRIEQIRQEMDEEGLEILRKHGYLAGGDASRAAAVHDRSPGARAARTTPPAPRPRPSRVAGAIVDASPHGPLLRQIGADPFPFLRGEGPTFRETLEAIVRATPVGPSLGLPLMLFGGWLRRLVAYWRPAEAEDGTVGSESAGLAERDGEGEDARSVEEIMRPWLEWDPSSVWPDARPGLAQALEELGLHEDSRRVLGRAEPVDLSRSEAYLLMLEAGASGLGVMVSAPPSRVRPSVVGGSTRTRCRGRHR